MRNLLFLLWVLLLADGVFVAVKADVTVVEGDSVTLKPSAEIPEKDTAEWWFGDKQIAQMNKAVGIFSTSGDNVGFRDRLELDKQTGSLTITNIRTDLTGVYTLKIRSTEVTTEIFSVTVRDVVESVSVMEGDYVTLHTGVTDKQSGDVIQWKFGDQDLNVPADESWSNIHLKKETGELTISNIRGDQTGDYKLEINTSSMILHRTLIITVSGKKMTISVKEGELIMLPTGLIDIRGYNLILWKFGDSSDVVAEIDEVTNRFLTHYSSDERFKGRLQLHPKSGSLSISDSRSTDSGDYHLDMSSSTHSVQRSISVTVKNKPAPVSGLSSAAVAGIVVVLLLVIAAGVIYHRHKISELERRRDVVSNGTNDPLNAETANSGAS